MGSHSPRVRPQQLLVTCTAERDWIDTFSAAANLLRAGFEINRASKYLPTYLHTLCHCQESISLSHTAIADYNTKTQEPGFLSHLLRSNRLERNPTPPLPHKHQHHIQQEIRLSILLAIHTSPRR